MRFADISTVIWARTLPPPVNELETVWRASDLLRRLTRPGTWLVVRVAGLDRDDAAAADQAEPAESDPLWTEGSRARASVVHPFQRRQQRPCPAGQPSGTPPTATLPMASRMMRPGQKPSPLSKVDHIQLRGRPQIRLGSKPMSDHQGAIGSLGRIPCKRRQRLSARICWAWSPRPAQQASAWIS
jgi:hypothetical protein